MKGSPEQPQCGFSSKIVNILKGDKISFNHFNILADSEIREGLKKYSNWPTYPQLYFGGKLVGGLDIVKELSEEGELRTMAPPEAIRE
jgi:Grx4 family monothiol glutaredoxin